MGNYDTLSQRQLTQLGTCSSLSQQQERKARIYGAKKTEWWEEMTVLCAYHNQWSSYCHYHNDNGFQFKKTRVLIFNVERFSCQASSHTIKHATTFFQERT